VIRGGGSAGATIDIPCFRSLHVRSKPPPGFDGAMHSTLASATLEYMDSMAHSHPAKRFGAANTGKLVIIIRRQFSRRVFQFAFIPIAKARTVLLFCCSSIPSLRQGLLSFLVQAAQQHGV
jgi:hypothetical protein